MNMNIANKLTILRVIMIPIFLLMLYSTFLSPSLTRHIATGIFVVASFTDFLDGYLARRLNLITNFGKFMDPLADKLLVCAAMVALVELHSLPAYAVIIIISREFIVTGFRLVAASNNVVIAASFWGKIKTVMQMIMLVYVLLDIKTYGVIYNSIHSLLIVLAVFFTILSGIDYIIKNIDVLKD